MALVVWSGGADSTLVLYDLLKDQRALDSDTKQEIRTISISQEQVIGGKESRKARDRIEKWLNKKDLYFERTEITIQQESKRGCLFSPAGLIQPVMWLAIACQYTLADEDLYFGYIREDDLWHYKGEFVYAHDNLKAIQRKTGVIRCPLEWENKYSVLCRLNKIGLLDLIWYCEDPQKGKPCSKCDPCNKHNGALSKLKAIEKAYKKVIEKENQNK